MRLVRILAATTFLSALLMLSSDGVQSQEKTKTPGKITGQLPPGWRELNLTATQREAVYRINAEAKEKIAKLEEEISKVRAEQSRKRLAVLTDEQRKKLRDSVAGEDPVKK